MHYADIKFPDIANGSGIRVSLFVSGCEFHCPHCFNPETWSFQYGKPFDDNTLHRILDCLSLPYCDGLTLLGGEPLHPRNIKDELALVTTVRSNIPNASIWCYTGYTYEELMQRNDADVVRQLLSQIDVLVDGRFVLEQKDLSLRFAGSSNQRLIDVQRSLAHDKIYLWT